MKIKEIYLKNQKLYTLYIKNNKSIIEVEAEPDEIDFNSVSISDIEKIIENSVSYNLELSDYLDKLIRKFYRENRDLLTNYCLSFYCSDEFLTKLLVIRDLGKCNMFSVDCIKDICLQLGFSDLFIFFSIIKLNSELKKLYTRLILRGEDEYNILKNKIREKFIKNELKADTKKIKKLL